MVAAVSVEGADSSGTDGMFSGFVGGVSGGVVSVALTLDPAADDSGKITVKRVNTPNSLSTRISAFIFRASILAIESPSPNPGIDKFVGLL